MQLIRHIDEIAREIRRDVLYLEFHPRERELRSAYDYRSDAKRHSVLEWLTARRVQWTPCGPIADLRLLDSYRGQIYLDVPFDKELPQFTELREFLEFPDGSMRHAGVRFYALSLEQALVNAGHDVAGFWDRWAERF
jgi:hypothetical protein